MSLIVSERVRWKLLVMFVISAAAFGSACSSKSTGTILSLEQRVLSYYKHEQSKNWAETYKFRTPAYRATVPKQAYIESMAKDDKDWLLINFEILSSQERNGMIEVSMKFIEKIPASVAPSMGIHTKDSKDTSEVTMEVLDTSIWKNIDGEWYCYDAATRGRLTMNATIVSE